MVRGPDRARGMQKIDREDFFTYPSRLSTLIDLKIPMKIKSRIRDHLFFDTYHLPTDLASNESINCQSIES